MPVSPDKGLIAETDRLILRIWHPEQDLLAGMRIWGDPEVMRYVDQGQPETEKSVRQSLIYADRHQHQHGCQHWAVVLKAEQELIGCCGFNLYAQASDHPELEMVFHFARPWWGQGYASEAGRAAIAYAWEHLRPGRIVAGVHPANTASKKVLLKLGFRDCGEVWFEDSQAYEPFFELKPQV